MLVFTPYYPPHIGGLMTHAAEFNTHLAQAGYEITVFTPHLRADAPAQEVTNSRITIYRFPAFEIIPNYPLPKVWHPRFIAIWRKVMQKKPDLLISRTRFFITSLLALLARIITKAPLLHIEHGSDFVQMRSPVIRRLARWYDHTLGKLVLRQADSVVANSHASADFVQQLAARSVPVVYRGIEEQKILSALPASSLRQNISPDATVITFAGRLIDGKGVRDLIRAAAVLKTKYQLTPQQFHLFLIGDGPERKNLHEQVHFLQLQNYVTFLGKLPVSKTLSALKASDIFVNPSYTEGHPSVVIEAALCNCAVVATDVGGTREIISNSWLGRLVPEARPLVLAAHLFDLIRHPEMRKILAAQAQSSLRGKYSWKKSIGEYQRIFKKLIPKEYD